VPRTVNVESEPRLAELAAAAARDGEDIIIETAEGPLAALVSIGKYHRCFEQRHRVLSVVKRIQSRNPDADPDEVERDVAEAIQEVREGQRP